MDSPKVLVHYIADRTVQ